MKKLSLSLLLFAAACTAGVADDSMTKEEASALGGKADGHDLCEINGWYGDGICDDFCAEPDPDCGGEASSCGGFAGFTCEEGQYCDYEGNSCGIADQLGTCKPIPDFCPKIFLPVCGCDGQTYDNDCMAASAGVSVAHQGACDEPDEPTSCGGFAGLTCDEGQYCQYEVGSCEDAEPIGTCEPMPELCPEIFAPVCGCDGQTYSNECFAAGAGVNIAHQGACDEPDEPESCGGFAGLTCDDGQYCNYEGNSCGFADQLGTCAPMPELCPEIFAPVCGCDGQTYSNECFAAGAGVSVAHDGACN